MAEANLPHQVIANTPDPNRAELNFLLNWINTAATEDPFMYHRDPSAGKAPTKPQPWISTKDLTRVEIAERIREEILRKRRLSRSQRLLERICNVIDPPPDFYNHPDETCWVRALPTDRTQNEDVWRRRRPSATSRRASSVGQAVKRFSYEGIWGFFGRRDSATAFEGPDIQRAANRAARQDPTETVDAQEIPPYRVTSLEEERNRQLSLTGRTPGVQPLNPGQSGITSAGAMRRGSVSPEVLREEYQRLLDGHTHSEQQVAQFEGAGAGPAGGLADDLADVHGPALHGLPASYGQNVEAYANPHVHSGGCCFRRAKIKPWDRGAVDQAVDPLHVEIQDSESPRGLGSDEPLVENLSTQFSFSQTPPGMEASQLAIERSHPHPSHGGLDQELEGLRTEERRQERISPPRRRSSSRFREDLPSTDTDVPNVPQVPVERQRTASVQDPLTPVLLGWRPRPVRDNSWNQWQDYEWPADGFRPDAARTMAPYESHSSDSDELGI